MIQNPFKIGLIQLAVAEDREATIAAHERAIRDAAGRARRSSACRSSSTLPTSAR
jgi:predicted amidohydrolase